MLCRLLSTTFPIFLLYFCTLIKFFIFAIERGFYGKKQCCFKMALKSRYRYNNFFFTLKRGFSIEIFFFSENTAFLCKKKPLKPCLPVLCMGHGAVPLGAAQVRKRTLTCHFLECQDEGTLKEPRSGFRTAEDRIS